MALDQIESVAERYARDGFVFPLDVMDPAAAKALRADYEAAEAELADDPERLKLLRTYPAQVLPSFDALIRDPRITDPVASILGPDLMVWGASFFTKEPASSSIVSWHQDLTYWGLDDAQEVTAWVALSPATAASGCMKFVPGSHNQQIVPHVDTFAEDNLLTRGQELAVEVDEADAVHAELQPGQISLHHGRLFHASGPNTTDDRRIGFAIRFIIPAMKQETGDRSLVALVRGEDAYGHFTIATPPTGRLQEADFDLCRRDVEIKQRVLYEDVDPSRTAKS